MGIGCHTMPKWIIWDMIISKLDPIEGKIIEPKVLAIGNSEMKHRKKQLKCVNWVVRKFHINNIWPHINIFGITERVEHGKTKKIRRNDNKNFSNLMNTTVTETISRMNFK